MTVVVCGACTARYSVGADTCPQCGSPTGTPSVLPTVGVACRTDGCPAAGRTRQVRLRPVGPGFVESPSLLCDRCGRGATVTPWYPNVEDNPMPKISAHGGPSDENAAPGELGHMPDPDGSTIDGTLEGGRPATPPPVNAPKADWVQHALTTDNNLTPAAAEAMTKADLQGKYGT